MGCAGLARNGMTAGRPAESCGKTGALATDSNVAIRSMIGMSRDGAPRLSHIQALIQRVDAGEDEAPDAA